jgi:hypothetical protein
MWMPAYGNVVDDIYRLNDDWIVELTLKTAPNFFLPNILLSSFWAKMSILLIDKILETLNSFEIFFGVIFTLTDYCNCNTESKMRSSQWGMRSSRWGWYLADWGWDLATGDEISPSADEV